MTKTDTTLEPASGVEAPPPPAAEDRVDLDPDERLARGADELVGGQRSLLAHPKFLLIASAILMSLGLTIIIVGWAGAAHSTLVEEQVPYLISGGLLGTALAVIGGLMLFAHWLTVTLRENRAHEAARRADHTELMTALAELSAVLTNQENSNGSARGSGDQRPLRASPRGS